MLKCFIINKLAFISKFIFFIGGSLAGALSASEPNFHLFPVLEIFWAKYQLAYSNTGILILIH